MAALLFAVVTAVIPAVAAAGPPGRLAWVETTDRGDHFRLMVQTPAGNAVLAPDVYGRPAFSPDGTQVAFTAPVTDGSDGRFALYVSFVDSSGRRQLTRPAIGDFDPAWSPDSRTLVVSRNERATLAASCCVLWLIAADGSGERRLDTAVSASQPVFSPDGGTLLYTGPDGIRAVPVAGGPGRLLARGDLSWAAPAPDGRVVAAVQRLGPEAGTIVLLPFEGGAAQDTGAGGAGGLPEAPVFISGTSILHLNAWGVGENGRNRAEVMRTDLPGGTTAVYSTGRPMFYLAWSAGRPCLQPTTSPVVGPPVDSPAVARFGAVFYRRSYTDGPAEACTNFGDMATDVYVSGDWDGNGSRTPGVFRQGVWYLRNTNSEGPADIVIRFGNPGDIPVTGDWNADGATTVGVFRRGIWYLRNSNTSGAADGAFTYGNPEDIPVVGDWNNDRTDTIGVFRSGYWYLTNRFDKGTADAVFRFGQAGDLPVPGDWNRDGTDTLGVFRGGLWYLSNRFNSDVAQGAFRFGQPGDRPILWR